MRKGGQVSAEALFSLGIVVLFFSAMALYSYERQQDAQDASDVREDARDCHSLASTINGLTINPGGSANVTLAGTATIRANARVVEAGEVSCRLVSRAVSNGTFGPGRLLLASNDDGNVTVQNE